MASKPVRRTLAGGGGVSRTHLLHFFPSFETGGVQRRFVTLANRLSERYRHTVIALDANLDAARGLESGVEIRFMNPPARKGSMLYAFEVKDLVTRLKPDLALTYNWGAMDGVAGARLASICPVIHTEDGFGVDEASTLKRRRVLARRVLLNQIYQTVVPSHTLYRIARERYCVATRKLRLILN